MVAAVPSADRAACERQVRMRDDALRVEELHRAQAVAARAGAHRVVEREKARLELRQRVVARRAGIARRKKVLLAVLHFDHHGLAVGVPQRGLERLGEPLARVRRVPAAGRRPRRPSACTFFARRGAASSSCTTPSMRTRVKPCARSSSSRSACSPLRPAIDRREDHDPRFLGQRGDLVDHLGHASAPRAQARAAGSRACRRARRGGAGSRGSRSPCRQSSADCGSTPFARSRSPARAPRSGPPPASP